MSFFGSASAGVGVLAGPRFEGTAWDLMCLPSRSRVGTTQVRLIRLLFPTTGTSNDGREDRKVVGHFLGVHGKIVDAVKASRDIYQDYLRFHFCYVRVPFEGGAVEVWCCRVLALASFYPVIANLPQAKVHFLMVFRVRSDLVFLDRFRA